MPFFDVCSISLFRISDNAHVLLVRVYVEGGVGGRGGCFYVSEGTLLLNDVILRRHVSIQGKRNVYRQCVQAMCTCNVYRQCVVWGLRHYFQYQTGKHTTWKMHESTVGRELTPLSLVSCCVSFNAPLRSLRPRHLLFFICSMFFLFPNQRRCDLFGRRRQSQYDGHQQYVKPVCIVHVGCTV